MTCLHPSKSISGVYKDGDAFIGVGWDCTTCGTSGLTAWDKASDNDRAEALLKHYETVSSELYAARRSARGSISPRGCGRS